MSVSEKYQAWLSCPAMTEELINDLRRMDDDAVHESFYRDLAFGTGGLRGILGAGTNRMNLFTVMTAGFTRGILPFSPLPFWLRRVFQSGSILSFSPRRC